MKWRRYLLLCSSSIVIMFLLSGCKERERVEPRTDLAVLSPALWADEAYELAYQWEPDAILVELVVDFYAVEKPAEGLVSFKFASSKRDHAHLTVWCSSRGCLPQEFQFDFVVQHCLAIDLDDWPIDAPEAVIIAQQNGLEQFIVRDITSNSVWLEKYPRCFGDQTVWVVRSVDLLARESLTVIVDAKTGEVLESSSIIQEPLGKMTGIDQIGYTSRCSKSFLAFL